MAFQMLLKNPSQVNAGYASAYWRVTTLALKPGEQRAEFVLTAFADKATSDAAKTDLTIQPLAIRPYATVPAEYETFFTPAELNPVNVNPYVQAYDYARVKQDVQTGNDPATGAPIYTSFFAAATDV